MGRTKKTKLSKEDALAEAKSLYSSLVPQLKSAGVPLDELNGVLFDEVLGKLTTPIDALCKALQDTMSSSSSASKAVEKLGTSITTGVSSFMTSLPLSKLFDELLPKLVKLMTLSSAALANPSLLAPTFSCSTQALPADLANNAQLESLTATLGSSLFGGNSTQRSRLFAALTAKFEAAFEPLREALPQLKELPAVVDAVQKSYADVSSATSAIKKLGKAQDEVQALLKALLGELAGEKGAGAVAEVNFMERVETVVAKAKEMDTLGSTLASASAAFSGAANSVFAFFRSLEFLVMKVSSVSWAPLIKSMQTLHAQYGPLMTDARKIMQPSGAMAAFMKPSEFLVRLEDAVKDVQKTVDLGDVASKLSTACDTFFPLLDLPADATKSATGPSSAQVSAFSTKSLGPIRDNLDTLLQMTKSQGLLFGNATQSLTSVLQVDVVSLMQTNVDKFSAAAAKKMADAALAEVQKIKDNVLKEVAELKANLVAQVHGELADLQNKAKAEAEQLRQMATDEAARMRTAALAEVNNVKQAAMDEANKIKSAATAEIAAVRQAAEKEVLQMKTAMLNEAKKEINEMKNTALSQIKQEGGQAAIGALAGLFK
jgi:vacuolar-type H+-ATPase subunit E/Vma4